MYTVAVSHSGEQTYLDLYDVPAVVYLIVEAYEQVVGPADWLYHLGLWPWRPIDEPMWWLNLGNWKFQACQWLHRWEWAHQRHVMSLPVHEAEVQRSFGWPTLT